MVRVIIDGRRMDFFKLCAVLVGWFFSSLIMAQQSQPQVFIVGVEEQLYYPHSQYKNKQFSGYAREFLDAFAVAKGYRFEYRVLPVNALFQQLLAREIDFKYPDNAYWRHDLKAGVRLAYSDPISPYIDGVFVTKKNQHQGLAALKTLGTIKGFTLLEYDYLVRQGRIKLVEYESIDQLIEQTLAGNLDGVFGSVEVINHRLASRYTGKETLVFNPKLPYTLQSYKLSTANRPRVLKELNSFLKDNVAMVERLQEKYGIKPLVEAQFK